MGFPLSFKEIAGVAVGAVTGGLIEAKGAKDVAKEQRKGAEDARESIEAAAKEAKEAVIPLFEQAREDALRGFGASLDVIGQAVPEQLRIFQEGNLAAQQTRLAGLQPFQQAVLGLTPDVSGLQPKGIDVDTSFLQQRVPVKTPTEQGFADLVQAINLDPIGAEQIFDRIKEGRQQSIEQGIPLQDILNPPAPETREPIPGRAGRTRRLGVEI